jgi:capsular polysaccharide biosynthesis protein
MNHDRLARIAQRTGAFAMLELVRIGLDPAKRKRWQILRGDYRRCRDQFADIAEQAPDGNLEKEAWMISTLSTAWGLKMEGLLSLALRFRGFSPRAVYLHHDPWSVRYHNIFKLRRAVYFVPTKARGPVVSDKRITDFVSSRPRISDLLRFDLNGVSIGRIALSNILNNHKFARLDIEDPETLRELELELSRVHKRVRAARELLEQRRPKIALLLDKGLSPMAELFGVCMDMGIPVIQYAGSQETNRFVFKRYSMANRYEHPFSIDPASWNRIRCMPWGRNYEDALMSEFAKSYSEGTWFNRKFLHQGKQIKPADEVRRQLGLDPMKKTAVIFSHVLWDATFFYGEGLFENYETWLLETVRLACRKPEVNWIIKLHPDLVWKLKYEGYTGELRDTIAIRSSVGKLPEFVKLVLPDTDISSYSFFAITDYCITVRGTIGIEMACHGIPVLTAGTGRYSGFGFTVDSRSKQEYLERLAHIEEIPAMTADQKELARRFAYALFHLRPWQATSCETVKLPMEMTGHPLDHNIELRLNSYDDLLRAKDLREFVEWVDSDAIDYFSNGARELACVESSA